VRDGSARGRAVFDVFGGRGPGGGFDSKSGALRLAVSIQGSARRGTAMAGQCGAGEGAQTFAGGVESGRNAGGFVSIDWDAMADGYGPEKGQPRPKSFKPAPQPRQNVMDGFTKPVRPEKLAFGRNKCV